MTQQRSNRETLIEKRLNKVESILETVSENHMRFDKKLDRISDEISETIKAIRQTNTAVDQTNAAVNMFVSAMIASRDTTSE